MRWSPSEKVYFAHRLSSIRIPHNYCNYRNLIFNSHLPIGVLCDLLYGENFEIFQINIRFSSFPALKLLRCSTYEAAQRHFQHSLKQSLTVLYGNSKILSTLDISRQNDIWYSACQGWHLK